SSATVSRSSPPAIARTAPESAFGAPASPASTHRTTRQNDRRPRQRRRARTNFSLATLEATAHRFEQRRVHARSALCERREPHRTTRGEGPRTRVLEARDPGRQDLLLPHRV